MKDMGWSNFVSPVQNPYNPSCRGDLQKGSIHPLCPYFLHPMKRIVELLVFDVMISYLKSDFYLEKPMELPNRICCTLEPPFTRFSWRLSGCKNLKTIASDASNQLACNGWWRQNIKPQHSHLQSQLHWSCTHGLNACSMMLSYIVWVCRLCWFRC